MNRPWGRWTRLFMDDQTELRLLEVEAGGYCTLHMHNDTLNVFVVTLGELDVLTYCSAIGSPRYWPKPSSSQWAIASRQTVVPLRFPLAVEPNIVHRFHAETKVIAYELNIATGAGPYNEHDSEQFGLAGCGPLPEGG